MWFDRVSKEPTVVDLQRQEYTILRVDFANVTKATKCHERIYGVEELAGGKAAVTLHEVSALEIIRAGEWRSVLFTTYTLSLGFFEGAVLPSLQRAGAKQIAIFSDVEGVSGALSEAGARHVGRAYSVEPVRNTSGVFHPKLTVLAGKDSPQLIIGSGNLTFGGWGRNIEVFEYLIPSDQPAAFKDAAQFLSRLSATPRISLSGATSLSEHASVIDAAGGDAAEGRVRILHNLEVGIASQLAAFAEVYGGAERLTLASPYFGGVHAARGLATRLGLDTFEVHVAQKVAVNGEHFRFGSERQAQPVVLEVLDEEGRDPRPLHAKLIEIVCARARFVVSGSVNVSRPALSEPANVELAVLRIVEDRQHFARANYTGDLPLIDAREESEPEANKAAVLSATYVGGELTGQLFVQGPQGKWFAQAIVGAECEDLGEIEVDQEGRFSLRAESLESSLYHTRRVTLTIKQADKEASGFVSFHDILAASHRLGGVASPLLRIAGGADDDADWISLLEWFAKNPEQTVSGWSSNRSKAQPKMFGDEAVAIDELRPRAEPDQIPAGGATPQATETLDRLLVRLRQVLRSPTDAYGFASHSTDEAQSQKDTKSQRAARKRLASAFERIVEVLSARVPHAPLQELTRLGEIGAFILIRHGDEPERIAEFLRHWFSLALSHLQRDDIDDDLCDLALGLSALASAFDGNIKRGRRQLLDLVGAGNSRAFSPEFETVTGRLSAIEALASKTVGQSLWRQALYDIQGIRISLDDVRAFCDAIDEASPIPALPTLSDNPNFQRALTLIARDRRDLLHRGSRTSKSCPRCYRNLPVAALEEFRCVGIARTECCSGVLLKNDV